MCSSDLCSIYKDANLGIPSAGIESYLPLFFDEQSSLFDYFPRSGDPVWLVNIGDVEQSIRNFWKDTQSRYEFLKHDLDRPILPPADLFLDVDEFFTTLKPHARLALDQSDSSEQEVAQFVPVPDIAVHRRDADPIFKLRTLVATKKLRIVISADSAGRKESIRQLIEESNLVFDQNTQNVYPLKPESFDSISDFVKSDALFGLATKIGRAHV